MKPEPDRHVAAQALAARFGAQGMLAEAAEVLASHRVPFETAMSFLTAHHASRAAAERTLARHGCFPSSAQPEANSASQAGSDSEVAGYEAKWAGYHACLRSANMPNGIRLAIGCGHPDY